MKLQNLTVIFVIIIIPVVLLVSLYITNGLKTIKYQAIYDSGLLTATHDAIYAFELNTTNDAYSDNAETKRNILKSSVKAFERSLCNTCDISSFNTKEIEEYIPAIMFGMYDGFYMYAPSLNSNGNYEHSLKNYVYYSEEVNDIIIRYSLDSYITVSGDFGGGYETKEGYLMVLDGSESDGTKYKGVNIYTSDDVAIKYYKEAYEFTKWFKDKVENIIGSSYTYFTIDANNDPEDENSAFTKHKKEVIKNKIEQVLNSTITAYSKRTTNTTVYKMPKLNVYDWEKIYSNISMVTFFQGKNIGLTNYNGYCVLNSTNSNEYVNPNLMYFINEGTYHDIRCTDMEGISTYSKGYRIGKFQKRKEAITDNSTGNTTYKYTYEHDENACYNCINGQISSKQSVYDYVRDPTTKNEIKSSYFTSLARERYNTVKLLETGKEEEKYEDTNTKTYTIKWAGDTSLKPAYFEVKTIINGEYKSTEGYSSSVSDITLQATTSGDRTEIKYEVNPVDNWKVVLNDDEKTITFTYIFVKYTVNLTFNDNDNLYGKRPNPTSIQIIAKSSTENKTVNIGDKVNSNWKTEDNMTVNSVMLDLELDDTKEWEFSVTPNTIDDYEVSYNRDEVYKNITITFKCKLKVVKWEIDDRDTTKINGKNNNGETLQTVNIGDYIIYNKGFNQKYYIGSDGVKSSESDEKIASLKESNWRIIGVSSEQLLIAASGNMPYIEISVVNDGNKIEQRINELEQITKSYYNANYVESTNDVRQINKADINNLMANLKFSEEMYGAQLGDSGIPMPIAFSQTVAKDNLMVDGWSNRKCYKIDKPLYDLLFPGVNYWIGTSYGNPLIGSYATGWSDGYQILYAANLREDSEQTWKGFYVRPVIKLKKGLIIYGSGETTEDGFLKYNIKN